MLEPRAMISTLLKTSDGPARSIMTVPLETTKATGIWPWARGLSGLLAAALSLAVVFCGLNERERADTGLAIAPTAANKPRAAERSTNSLRFIMHLTTERALAYSAA